MLPQLLATEYMKRYDIDAAILKMRENYSHMVDMSKKCSALRLNYSTVSDERIIEGIKRLGIVFSEALN